MNNVIEREMRGRAVPAHERPTEGNSKATQHFTRRECVIRGRQLGPCHVMSRTKITV